MIQSSQKLWLENFSANPNDKPAIITYILIYQVVLITISGPSNIAQHKSNEQVHVCYITSGLSNGLYNVSSSMPKRNDIFRLCQKMLRTTFLTLLYFEYTPSQQTSRDKRIAPGNQTQIDHCWTWIEWSQIDMHVHALISLESYIVIYLIVLQQTSRVYNSKIRRDSKC